MSNKTKERIHLGYGIALGLLILAVGGCFALSCLSIYKSGDSPFTRESISTHFDRMAIPVYVCLAGVLGGGVLALVLPMEDKKLKPRREAGISLKKLTAKLDLDACEASVRDAVRKEQGFRRWTTVAAGILSALILFPAIAWCVNPTHFTIENLNQDVKTAAVLVISCAVIAMGAWIAVVLLCGASISRETSAVKAALAAGQGGAAKQAQRENPSPAKKKLTADPRFMWAVRCLILIVGVVFIALGVLNGGMADVLGKAIRICTECIGLG